MTSIYKKSKLKSKSHHKTNLHPSPSLNQGELFNKYQTNMIDLDNTKEGFNTLTKQTNQVISNNNYSNQQPIINSLREEYNNTSTLYETLMKKITGNMTDYVDRLNPSNPYLNKVVAFSDGTICYVTNQGVAKYIPSQQIWDSLQVSKTPQVSLQIKWLPSYNTPGTEISTTPPLISGTPLILGQSVGNEGSNIFVSKFLNATVTPSYMGCYANNTDNTNMTFIGNKPSSLANIQITNGTFSQPPISANTYNYITSSSQVPGWYFSGACLLNNSTVWGFSIPYPAGNQCVCLQNASYMYTTLPLSSSVSYTVTFSACSRDCCNSPNVGNPINLQLYTSLNAFISTIANFTPATLNTWETYSYTFTVPTTQNYNLYFSGTNVSGDQSTAIANVGINTAAESSGDYTYDDCNEAAISSGYQYFGLQNVNTSTGKGYCAVSNSQPAITKYGTSMIPNKMVVLWSSNTSSQSGNTATLSVTGSLQVINSSGRAVYSSPSANANPSNYYGCYGDSRNRAMTMYNKAASKYNNSQCQQIAVQNGYAYYGLQNSNNGSNAQCALSNNLSEATKYGKATNCTQLSDGSWSGGGWANAIYNTNSPQSNYFLQLQDDGNMVVYSGTSPDDNQGMIWSTNTTGKQQSANPAVIASLGKYGKNWITSGSILSPGDFIGSTTGELALYMESDGNLVLYTYQMATNCQKTSGGNMGGGVGANAMYNIGEMSIPQNMGQLAYIDSDSNLYTYPTSNITYSSSYATIPNVNSSGNDIPNSNFNNATVSSCESACNSNDACAGFVFDTATSICYPKNYNMYPYGSGNISNSLNTDVYFKSKIPLKPPLGVSQNTNNTDSLTYKNYSNKGEIGSEYGLSNATTVQKQQLGQLKTQMEQLSIQILDLNTKFQSGTISAENQSIANSNGINNYLDDLTNTNAKISGTSNENSGGIQNILNDSDIVVLQKNYNYLFWSILAAGTVLISINVVKQ